MMIRLTGPLLASFLLVVGCGGSDSAGPGGGDGSSLDGRTFLSTSVLEDGRPRQLVAGTRLRLIFDNGNLSASVGCNSMSGPVTISDGKIGVTDLATTEMGCDKPRHEQDMWIGGFQAGDPAYRLDGDTLVLTSGATEIKLLDRKVAEPDKPLKNTRWQVESLVDHDSVSSVPGSGEAFFVFADGDKVSGSTGCNQFGGSAVEGNGQIVFSKLFLTKMACSGDANTLEQAVKKIFDAGAVSWRIDSDRLILTGTGSTGLELRATS